MHSDILHNLKMQYFNKSKVSDERYVTLRKKGIAMQTQLIQIRISDNQVVSLPCIKDGPKLIKVFDYEKNELKYDSVRDAVFYKNGWRQVFSYVSPKIPDDEFWDNLPRVD